MTNLTIECAQIFQCSIGYINVILAACNHRCASLWGMRLACSHHNEYTMLCRLWLSIELLALDREPLDGRPTQWGFATRALLASLFDWLVYSPLNQTQRAVEIPGRDPVQAINSSMSRLCKTSRRAIPGILSLSLSRLVYTTCSAIYLFFLK